MDKLLLQHEVEVLLVARDGGHDPEYGWFDSHSLEGAVEVARAHYAGKSGASALTKYTATGRVRYGKLGGWPA